MRGRTLLIQASVIAFVMTSSPLVLLMTMLPSAVLQASAASSLPSEPGCHFPKFLQTRRNKPWMMKHANTITTFDVDGGSIFVRSASCLRSRDYHRRKPSSSAECVKLNYTRVCLEKRRGNKYLVRHVESDFGDKFLCLEFLKRGISVVQVKMSLIEGAGFVDRLCDERYMHVDPWPWISEEHYRSAPVNCPFAGGYNLLMKYSSPPPAGNYEFYRASYPAASNGGPDKCTDTSTSPIRLESDCVPREGMVFSFKHQSCLPAGTHLSLRQRALCMATWEDGDNLFAMLRADNHDRAFYCLRIRPKKRADNVHGGDYYQDFREGNMEIDEVVLFIAWVCPTSSYDDAARRYSPGPRGYSDLAPHMAFTVHDQRLISEPCSDELATCHNHTNFCRHLHCMRTCGQCLVDDPYGPNGAESLERGGSDRVEKKATVLGHYRMGYVSDDGGGDMSDGGGGGGGEEVVNRAETLPPNSEERERNPQKNSDRKPSYQRKCTFPESMRGTWLQRNPNGSDTKLVITESTFQHPSLGHFQCVTFTPPGSEATPLRRVLWSRYDNGCYPRLTCLHYNTPAKAVMRYRLANIQHWPLPLSDHSICAQKNFLEAPDLFQPGDKYALRSWEVVRRSGNTHSVACILPHYLPKVVSFLDDRGRSGCLVHGTYYSPRAVILASFPPPSRPGETSVTPTNRTQNRDVSGRYDDVDLRKTYPKQETGRDDVPADDSVYNEHPQTVDYPSDAGTRLQDQSPYRADPGRYRQGNQASSDQWSEKLRGSYQSKTGASQYPVPPQQYDQDETFLFMKSQNSGRPGDQGLLYYGTYPADAENRGLVRSGSYQNDGVRYGRAQDRTSRHRHRSLDPYRRRRGRQRRNVIVDSVSQTFYSCLAVMTYVDSYKSLLTETSSDPDEILCWLVVNETTIVILKTSSCNSETAQQVLAEQANTAQYSQHVHRVLHLHRGERDCQDRFPTHPVRPELSEFREDDKQDSGASSSSVGMSWWTSSLVTVLTMAAIRMNR